jgi:hypothetical protein
VTASRRAFALAACSATAALACVASASGAGTIWPECTSGSLTETCQESRWYAGPVAVVWHASPAPEETSPCLLGIEYLIETDSVRNLLCSARWRESGTDRREVTVHVEVSTPTAEVIPERPSDFNGWYNHPLAITFKAKGYSGPATCHTGSPSATATYAGPDSLGAAVGATCVDPAGKSVAPSFGLRYDATPPKITGAFASRPPDFGGWYNHPITFAFTGSDATSGFEPCSVTYAGPDTDTAEAVGICHDRAGNTAALSVPLHYHATPPSLKVRVSPGDGRVSLSWRATGRVQVVRSPGLRGAHASRLYEGTSRSFTDTHLRDGARYTYSVRAKDGAGNITKRSITVTVGPRLVAPVNNALVSTPPLLRWTPVRGASYYNVQLFRDHKLLSTWPVRSTLQLNRAWRFRGQQYQLTPGRYAWYVWPGFGEIGAGRYGRLIGHSTFVVR